MSEEKTKKCPYCAEEINEEAIKCKHCKSDLTEVIEKERAEKRKKELEKKKAEREKAGKQVVIWILIAFVSIWIWYLTIPIIAIWFIWKRTKLTKKKKWIITSLSVVLLFIFIGIKTNSIAGPPITIVEPENNITVQGQDTITIKGTINHKGSKVTVNGQSLVAENGLFSYRAKLDKEKNDFRFIAKKSGMVAETILTINRIFTEEEKAEIEKKKAEEEAKRKEAEEAKERAEEEKRAKELAEQKAWEASKAGQICKAHPEWSKSDCEGLADNKIWIGMTFDMLKYKRGLPNSSNPSNYGYGTEWQWCWHNYTPSCFYGDSDGIVDSYN